MENRATLYAEIVKAGEITLKGVEVRGGDPCEVDVDRRVTVRMVHTEEKEGILIGDRLIEVYADFSDEDAMTMHITTNTAWEPGDVYPNDQFGHDGAHGVALCNLYEIFEGYNRVYTAVYVFF